MGYLADSLAAVHTAGAPPAEDPSILGEVSKGFSRGLRSTGGAIEQAAGLGAEALGFNEAAQSLRSGAQGLREAAAAPQFAPESADWDSVHGAGQAVRWAAGHAGSMVPIMGGAIAAGALTRSPMLGGTAAMLPVQVGDIDERQQANPEIAAQPVGERGLRALAYGGIGAAAMNVPFAGLAGKFGAGAERAVAGSFLGNTAKSVGEGVVTGGLGMGSAEVANQLGTDPNAPVEMGAVKDAAIGGAVTMGMAHAAGAIPAHLKRSADAAGSAVSGAFDRAKQSINEKLAARKAQAATDATGSADAQDAANLAAGKKVGTVYDSAMDLLNKAKDSTSDFAERIAKGEPVGYKHADIVGASPEKVWEHIQKNAGEAAAWAKTTGAEMLDSMGVDDARRAELTKAMDNIADPASQKIVAGMKLAGDATKAVGEKITGLWDAVHKGYSDAKKASTWPEDGVIDVQAHEVGDAPKLLKSEDMSGARMAVMQGMRDSGIMKRRPDIFGDKLKADQRGVANDKINAMADSLNLIAQNIHKKDLPSDVVAQAIDVFGEDAHSVITSVSKALAKANLDPVQNEQMFKNLNKVAAVQKASKSVREAIINAGTDEMRSQNFKDIDRLERMLMAHARGELAPAGGFKRRGAGEKGDALDGARSAEDLATEGVINDLYEQRFGANADAVRTAVQKAAKAEKGSEHTGEREYTDDGELKIKAQDKVPQGQSPLFDQEGNRIEVEDKDTMRYGLTAPNKLGNSKMRRNGRMYPDPESLDPNARYTKQHLADLKAKYPDKEVAFEPNEEGTHGHITVKERLNPEDVSDESIDKMRLNTKKYPKSESRMEFDVGEKTEKGDPKPLILDTMAVSREMGNRSPQGAAEGDLTFAHRLSRQFMDGISALTSKFGAVPHIPDNAVIGHVGGEKFTWGMAQKMRKTTITDSFMDADREHLHRMQVDLDRATLSQEALRAKGLTQKDLPFEHIKELKADIKALRSSMEFDKNRELSFDENTNERAAASARFAKKGEMGMKGPLNEKSTAYTKGHEILDKDGNGTGRYEGGMLTAEGLRQMMAGDYHGGIEVGKSSSRAPEAERAGGDARFDNMEFDGGTGQTQIGKDAQVHTAFAGGKDEPFFGGAYDSARPQQEGNVVRANQDGSSHFVSDRWGQAQQMAAMGHELMAKSSAVSKALGDKIVRLTAPDVMSRMEPRAMDDMAKATMPGLANSSRAALVNKLADHYLKAADEQIVSYKERMDARRDDKRGPESEVDYNSREHANMSLMEKINSMSDNAAQMELRRRERLLDKAAPGSDWHDLISSEVAALQDRLANGRDLGPRMEYAPDGGTQRKPVGTIGEGKGMYGMGRADARPRFSSVGEDAGTSRMEVAPGQTAGTPTGRTPRMEVNSEPSNAAMTQRLQNNGGAPNPKELAAKKAALLEAASSSDPKLHQELATSTDAKGLQRAIATLAEHAPKSEALAVAVKRMTELVKDESVAYALQGKKYSMDTSRADAKGTASSDVRKAVEDHIAKVLGPKISVLWRGLSDMAYAGDYSHQQKTIRLSVHALNPMGTAFHESLHSFIGSMKDAGAHDVAATLEKAASSRMVIEQLQEIYKGQPEVLRQLANAEERAAYMYQHWALDAGFKMPVGGQGIMGKISAFINRLLGNWTNDERAVHIMKYFHEGEFAKNADKPGVVRRALMETHKSAILEKAREFTQPLADVADAVVTAGGARMRETGIPALSDLADIIKRQGTDGRGGDRGFTSAARIETAKRIGELGNRLGDAAGKPDVLNTALTYLQAGEFGKNTTPEQRLAARPVIKAVQEMLRETHDYMKASGVEIGDLGPKYFPREWDTHYISKNMQAFRDMLEPYKRSGKMKGEVDTLVKNLMSQGGSELGIEGRDGRETREPGMQFKKQRVLDFIDPRDAAEFQKKELMSTVSSYITQAVRKAEWTKRLGGDKLDKLLLRAKEQGATQQHLDMAEDYMKANDGTLGDTLNPTARRLMGNMIVYQNVRLLPMASFSMLIDPLGTMVRGAKLGEAWSTFKRGMAGIPETFSKEGGGVRDQQTKWAELVGVVDSAMMSHAMSDVYTQGMVGGTAKDINNTFFKYNMVEGLNRNFRIGATESAMKFIQRHGLGDPVSGHSDRWIRELGLIKGDIKEVDGRLALTQAEGLTAAQEARVHAAVNQWVDGSILRPDAADKPIWMNDPHYALISHLKQFVYSFQHTILERVGHEINHGNYAPAMALASYLPVMMAADFAKNFIVNGGGTPDWQKGWDMTDYVENGIERSGFYGVGQFGVDIAKNIHRGGSGAFALAGPTLEQLRDSVETLGGHKQFSTLAIDALPMNALYKPALGAEGKADPVFAE